MKKYPLTWFIVLGICNLIIGLTTWRFIDYFVDEIEIYNPIFGIYLGLTSVIWCIILFKYWNKFWKIEEKTRNKNFGNKIKNCKSVVLIIKRNILANVSLIFSVILLYVFLVLLFPSPEFSGIGYTITRIAGGLWFVYGLIFSCLVYKKKLVFENDKFTIVHKGGTTVVEVDEIVDVRLKVKDPTKDYLRQFLFADIEIELTDSRKLICDNAEGVMNISAKIKSIQKYCSKSNLN